MLKVHGFAVSNYHNMVRMALLEKGASFDVVDAFPAQEEGFLARSPMGKVPALETPDGFIAETSVILEYIEEVVPGPRLLPADPFARARVREAMKMIELYIELPARRLFPGVLMGGSNPEQTVQEVDPVLRRGVAALARVLDCRRFVMGDALTLADIVAVFTFPIAAMVTRKVYGRELLESFPELAAVLVSLSERPSVKLLDAESRAGMEAFQARIRKRG
jgi:glutathione S-transferase